MTRPSSSIPPAHISLSVGEPTTARSCQSIAVAGLSFVPTISPVSHLSVSRRRGRALSTMGGFACPAKISCSGRPS